MENPATWGRAEWVVHNVFMPWLSDYQEHKPQCGLSFERQVADALREEGLLTEGLVLMDLECAWCLMGTCDCFGRDAEGHSDLDPPQAAVTIVKGVALCRSCARSKTAKARQEDVLYKGERTTEEDAGTGT